MIDGIFFINLNNRPDRLKFIRSELSRMSLIPEDKIYRVEAILHKRCGYLGCTDSHIKALQLAKEKGCKYPLILEDDFRFEQSKEVFFSTLTQLPSEWDVFMLAVCNHDFKTKKGYIRQINCSTTASGYIVRGHYIDTLLANILEGRALLAEWVDQEVAKDPVCRLHSCPHAHDQHWFPIQEKHVWYTSVPSLGNQNYELRSSNLGNED